MTNNQPKLDPTVIARNALSAWDSADAKAGTARQSLAYAIILLGQSVAKDDPLSTSRVAGWHARKDSKDKTLSLITVALLGPKPKLDKGAGKTAKFGALTAQYSRQAGRVRLGLMFASALLANGYATSSYNAGRGVWSVSFGHMAPTGAHQIGKAVAVIPLTGQTFSFIDGDSFKTARASVETFMSIAGKVTRGSKASPQTAEAKSLSSILDNVAFIKKLATSKDMEAVRAGLKGADVAKLVDLANAIAALVAARKAEAEASDRGEARKTA